jgi:hypothetical protein
VTNAAVLFDHEIAIFADKQNQNPSKSPLIESLLREGAPIPADVSAFPSRAVSQLGQFFRFLVDKTGGRYRAFAPTSRLPQVGDVNGDYCVNKKDLSLVTASLGSRVDRYSPLDPNQNGVVDIYDEETVKKHMGQCKQ